MEGIESIEVGAIYRHFKGNRYKVLMICIESDTLEPLVIYQALGYKRVWARTFESWNNPLHPTEVKKYGQTIRFLKES